MRGLSFEIPNQYGRYFYDILEDININKYFWKSGDGEAYNIENNELGAAMFPHPYTYNGEDFYNQISAKDYYVIFADLKAFKEKHKCRLLPHMKISLLASVKSSF